MLKRPVVTVVLLVVLLAAGAFFSLRGGKEMTILGDSGAPPLQFYTSPGVTTPQLAFWSAYKNGDLKSFLPLAVNYWKDLDQLKTLVVAGKGDLWLGHLEGFALARRLGAPVKVIAVSGWRKFYFLSRDDSIRRPEDLAGKLVPYTPPGSPVLLIAQALLRRLNVRAQFEPVEIKQLSLMLVGGRVSAAFAPEPLVTVLLRQSKDLRVVFNLEQEYGRRFNKPERLPLAGFAVNTRTLGGDPAKVDELVRILGENNELISAQPEKGLEALPPEFAQAVSPDVLRESLTRDMLLVEPAWKVKDEIKDYLMLVLPEAEKELKAGAAEELLWRPGGAEAGER